MAKKNYVKYSKNFVEDEFSIDTTVTLPAGKYTEVFVMSVPAQQIRTWGARGILGTGVDDRGTLTFAIKDASGTTIAGSARMIVTDAGRNSRVPLEEVRSTEGVTGRRVAEAKDKYVGEDSLLILEYKPDSDATATGANCTISAPITILSKVLKIN